MKKKVIQGEVSSYLFVSKRHCLATPSAKCRSKANSPHSARISQHALVRKSGDAAIQKSR